MRKFVVLVCAAIALAACGGPPSPTADQAVATIGAGLNPATVAPIETPTPRPTEAERARLKIVANRLMLMHRAAQQLNDPQITSGSDWRTKVNTQVTILRGARGAIDRAELPERYHTPRLTEILDGCAAIGERLGRADVQRSDLLSIDGLERCVNGLRQMESVYTEYTR